MIMGLILFYELVIWNQMEDSWKTKYIIIHFSTFLEDILSYIYSIILIIAVVTNLKDYDPSSDKGLFVINSTISINFITFNKLQYCNYYFKMVSAAVQLLKMKLLKIRKY